MDVLVAAAVTVSRWGTTGSVVGTLARTSHSAASGSQGPPPPAGRHDTPEAATLHTGCLYTACQQRTEGLRFNADIADTEPVYKQLFSQFIKSLISYLKHLQHNV